MPRREFGRLNCTKVKLELFKRRRRPRRRLLFQAKTFEIGIKLKDGGNGGIQVSLNCTFNKCHWHACFFNWANPASFVYFRPFLIAIAITVSISTIQIEESIDSLLGIRTRGRRIVGAHTMAAIH